MVLAVKCFWKYQDRTCVFRRTRMATAWPQSKPGVPGPYRPVGQSVFGSQAFSLFCPSPKDDIDTETELHLVISLAKNSQQAQPH